MALLTLAAGGGYYGFCRYLCGNFWAVVDGRVYRSAQPSAAQLEAWTERYSLRTVINLRGENDSEIYRAEQQAAERLGLGLIDIEMTARRLPGLIEVRELVQVIESAEQPILLHCLDGADRAGVAGAISAMAVGGANYERARDQLSIKFFHYDPRGEGVAGLLGEYEQHCRLKGLETAGWKQFRRWSLETYKPGYYYALIEVPGEITTGPAESVRVEATVKNGSNHDLPLSDPSKTFMLAAFTGTSVSQMPKRLGGTRLPLRDLRPGGSLKVQVQFKAPQEPGRIVVCFDLVEEHVTWFAHRGSPMAECLLVVK